MIDTYYRMIHSPAYFVDYIHQNFMIPYYTCNDYTGKIVQYHELLTVYGCFCNNGDYHQMPSISFELDKQKI